MVALRSCRSIRLTTMARTSTPRASSSGGPLVPRTSKSVAYSPETGLFYVPTNHVCMDYEPLQGELHGRPALCRGRRCRCSRRPAKPTWATSLPGTPPPARSWRATRSSSPCGPARSRPRGGVVFYGTLEGYLKAVDAKTGKELYKFKTPSGIIGNVMTHERGGKQYVAVMSRRRRLRHRPRGPGRRIRPTASGCRGRATRRSATIPRSADSSPCLHCPDALRIVCWSADASAPTTTRQHPL